MTLDQLIGTLTSEGETARSTNRLGMRILNEFMHSQGEISSQRTVKKVTNFYLRTQQERRLLFVFCDGILLLRMMDINNRCVMDAFKY
jgi:hypothetical protein